MLLADAGQVTPYVLILDDDKTFGQTLCAGLKTEGIPAVAVAAAASALELLRQRPPALILLDLVMPHMNGEQFLGILKSQIGTANIPIVVVSARINDVRASELSALGVNATVAKSKTTMAEIRGLVKKYLKGPQSNAA